LAAKEIIFMQIYIIDEVMKRHITFVVIVLTADDTVEHCRRAFKQRVCWDYI
jgi:response regulator of citrate/malate metabolism